MLIKYLYIIPLTNVFLCIGLSVFTFTRNPKHLSNLGFLLGMLCLVTIETGHAMILLSGSPVESTLVGMRISLIGQAFLAPSWLFFTIVFARSNYRSILKRWIKVIIALIIISVVFLFLINSTPFVLLSPFYINDNIESLTFSSHPLFVFSPVGRYFYIYLIAGILLSLINLEQTLRSSKGSKRWQIKYIILGLGSILFFFVYVSSQALLFSSLTLQLIPLISIVILISTLIMALFIVRHKLLDVDIFISRHIVYSSVTVFIVGIYLILTGIVVEGIKYFDTSYNYFFSTLFVFIAILVLVVLLFMTKIRRKIQLFINRNFYKHKYEFRDKWMETIERLGSKSSNDEICATLLDMISETMAPRSISLWLYNPVFRDYRSFNKQEPEDIAVIKNSNALIRQINKEMNPFFIDDVYEDRDLDENGRKELYNLKKISKTILCSPLIAGEDIVGFILQGEDLSGEPYIADDFELLKAVTTQSAIQLKSVQLVNELLSVREVEVFHKMSAFIMHDLKNLTNSLSLVSQNAAKNMDNPEFQKDTIRTIDNTVLRMKGLIDRFSSVPKGLDLNVKEVMVKPLIHEAIKKIGAKGDKNVVLRCEIGDIPAIYIDPHAVEMVLINLMNNAFDAIENKGEIKIAAFKESNYVHIKISDDGKGMSKEFMESSLFMPFKSSKKSGFGIGLYQSKTVIDAHGGMLEFSSKEGEGTSFTVKLPVGDKKV